MSEFNDNQNLEGESSGVRVWREEMTIPTYKPHAPDANPMFFETRITQGAKGNIYPMPLTDRLTDKKTVEVYNAVHIENEYIRLTVLPEIGGKIYAAQDKTNDYDFIYRNNVIKPALIGLCGPWISGGIEFNWPQHHRPTTFSPVDCVIEEGEDGSKTVWVGEVEPLYRTKGMVGITLHPGKSYIEARVRLYNRTPFPQSFLWWANLAVHVNEHYKAVFPPDVDYVTFHAKTEVTPFPVVKGKFAGIDYGDGTDITFYKNVPAPSSFFIFNSNYFFMGGYDLSKDAGVIHVADNNISTGKKIFTWGTGEFGQRWCQNLTDNDGPYIEIMTGAYTDNQPDFSWLQPYETKTFNQFWYPVKDIGLVKSANINGAVSLEIEENTIKSGFYVTAAHDSAMAVIKLKEKVIFEEEINISPDRPFKISIPVPKYTKEEDLEIMLRSDGKELVGYKYRGKYHSEAPKAVPSPKRPEEIITNEELYINGLHLEQYKHPTIEPEPYYEEALRREPGDSRCNNAMGLICMRRGRFEKAAEYFNNAIHTLTQRNPNPYDGEAYYNLGLSLRYMDRQDEAYKAFYKATWSYAWKTAGYQSLAEIDCLRGEYLIALEHINKSLTTNSENLRALNLKTAILRRLGRRKEAEKLSISIINLDKLDFKSRFEFYLIRRLQCCGSESEKMVKELQTLMRGQAEAYLDIAIDYGIGGFFIEAASFLSIIADELENKGKAYPMIYYYMGYYSECMNNRETAFKYYRLAAQTSSEYCFPCRLESIAVLKAAQKANPHDAKAFYYLGNLFYDKRQYDEAINNWERSRELDGSFAVVHRNLALAYFEKKKDVAAAKTSMEKAFEINNRDSRLLFELIQLYKCINVPVEERLELLNRYDNLVEERDDLYLSKIVLCTLLGRYDDSIRLLNSRHFHPYEGGEGVLTEQHTAIHILRGMEHLKNLEYECAIYDFSNALRFPERFGEGKRYGMPEAHVNYHLGLAYEAAGDMTTAHEFYERAAKEKTLLREIDYYRGMALLRLGCEAEAKEIFEEIIKYAEREIQKGGCLGYTTNIPTILPFEQDIEKKNRVANGYLLGLGYKALGRKSQATEEFKKVLELDINHLQARIQLKDLEENL